MCFYFFRNRVEIQKNETIGKTYIILYQLTLQNTAKDLHEDNQFFLLLFFFFFFFFFTLLCFLCLYL